MKTVVFVSEKGGVGKTRLSDELYFYYTRQGVPASLYSFDGQYKNRNPCKYPRRKKIGFQILQSMV